MFPAIINVTMLADLTKNFASSGLIDSTRTMLEDRVFIWTGTNDILTTPSQWSRAFILLVTRLLSSSVSKRAYILIIIDIS